MLYKYLLNYGLLENEKHTETFMNCQTLQPIIWLLTDLLRTNLITIINLLLIMYIIIYIYIFAL